MGGGEGEDFLCRSNAALQLGHMNKLSCFWVAHYHPNQHLRSRIISTYLLHLADFLLEEISWEMSVKILGKDLLLYGVPLLQLNWLKIAILLLIFKPAKRATNSALQVNTMEVAHLELHFWNALLASIFDHRRLLVALTEFLLECPEAHSCMHEMLCFQK